jgi:predicted AAA+ superfamily ATPase
MGFLCYKVIFYQEYLSAHDVAPIKKPFGQASFDKMQQHLTHYFSTGGFPAVQSMISNEWRETLQNYVDTTILRDIIERYNVTNIALLKYLTTALLKNAATNFSINKFYNDIKSQGYKVGKETLHNYLDYIQDAFLIFTVPLYSESERAKNNQPKKIYAIDNGLVNALSFSVNDLYGKAFENLIYLDLRRQCKDIYYYKTANDYEINFVAIDKAGNRELLQVVWEVSDPNTLEREQRALAQVEQELGIKGRLVTPRDYLAGDFLNN